MLFLLQHHWSVRLRWWLSFSGLHLHDRNAAFPLLIGLDCSNQMSLGDLRYTWDDLPDLHCRSSWYWVLVQFDSSLSEHTRDRAVGADATSLELFLKLLFVQAFKVSSCLYCLQLLWSLNSARSFFIWTSKFSNASFLESFGITQVNYLSRLILLFPDASPCFRVLELIKNCCSDVSSCFFSSFPPSSQICLIFESFGEMALYICIAWWELALTALSSVGNGRIEIRNGFPKTVPMPISLVIRKSIFRLPFPLPVSIHFIIIMALSTAQIFSECFSSFTAMMQSGRM